jgi:hypothetical protein
LHYYLDYKNDSTVGFIYSFAAPLQYFQPHKKSVDNKLLKLQHICNLLLMLAFVALLLNIIFGVAIYLKYK